MNIYFCESLIWINFSSWSKKFYATEKVFPLTFKPQQLQQSKLQWGKGGGEEIKQTEICVENVHILLSGEIERVHAVGISARTALADQDINTKNNFYNKKRNRIGVCMGSLELFDKADKISINHLKSSGWNGIEVILSKHLNNKIRYFLFYQLAQRSLSGINWLPW